MSESECITCGQQFDYFQKAATIICSKNHMICRLCYVQLLRANSRCPYCFNELKIQKLDGLPINQTQDFQSSKNYWNQTNYSNIPHPFGSSKGIHRQYSSNQIKEVKKNKNGKYCLFSLIFLIIFVILLIVRIKMQSCSFWNAVECKKEYGIVYCRQSSECIMLPFVQSFGGVAATEVGMGLSFFLMIAFFCHYLFKKKVQRQRELMVNRFQSLKDGYQSMRT